MKKELVESFDAWFYSIDGDIARISITNGYKEVHYGECSLEQVKEWNLKEGQRFLIKFYEINGDNKNLKMEIEPIEFKVLSKEELELLDIEVRKIFN